MIEESAARWRKSSYSGTGGGSTNDCVEVAIAMHEVGVRDTKDRVGGQLTVTASAWSAFVRATMR
ncbi:DUF397 domain-containing protein [Amycolatopsis sp. CA-230715]|uniref:DUF397 domain-containing protein n=1 Tax=Amycolatopsis sp. CA-230715 TaxID=2745196 RepID=UPI001C00DD0E|nr:DUF397 domain-containing protein [Amycolatopsis sp. CA-230715]QWF79196.1 hypothetical protein HUW46_02603 [Amycolatopsis sp. CA-230715]